MTHRPIILYKSGPNKIYTHYGIPFQCVELIRRYLILYYGLTFQSIPDAFDMFSSVNSLIHIKTNRNILLETIFSKDVDDLRVGDIIFWDNEYYELDNVDANQYFAGKNPETWPNGSSHGYSVSVICNAHATRQNPWGITNLRRGGNNSSFSYKG